MPLYRYTITPRGAFGTPMRSDTLHGQLLCAAAELDGGEAVAGLIAAFDSDNLFFVCSSAFPAGMLPMPCLPRFEWIAASFLSSSAATRAPTPSGGP